MTKVFNKLAFATATVIVFGASPALAAPTIFSSNPTGNSGDFATAVAAAGGSVVSNITFDGLPVNATYSSTGSASVAYGVGPGQGNNYTTPLSAGEGVHQSSGYLSLSAGSLTVNFIAPVFAAGLTTIDLFNPYNINPVSFSAYTGINGTGTLIGTATAAAFNFQPNNTYFLGISTDTSAISSIVFQSAGGGGDVIGLDNVVSGVAAVPEPTSWAMMILGMGAVGFAMRSAKRRSDEKFDAKIKKITYGAIA